jgi:hypothetical protein
VTTLKRRKKKIHDPLSWGGSDVLKKLKVGDVVKVGRKLWKCVATMSKRNDK